MFFWIPGKGCQRDKLLWKGVRCASKPAHRPHRLVHSPVPFAGLDTGPSLTTFDLERASPLLSPVSYSLK